MTPNSLRGLLQLAEARKARDLARLEAALSADRAFTAEIAEAMGALGRDAADLSAPPLPFAQAAARDAWVDQRIRAARRGRAALVPVIAAARAEAAQSLGKHSALEHMLERAEAEAKALRLSRTERDAPPAAAPPAD